MEITRDSPAETAGLNPYEDWIVGTQDHPIKGVEQLVDVVNAKMLQQLAIYVFNSRSEEIRQVVVVPDFEWNMKLPADHPARRTHQGALGNCRS